MSEVRRLLISGTVQGVGFRYFMVAEAQRLGLTGWVRNRRDGSVEAIVSGTAGAVAAMIARVRRGPPGATVDQVCAEETEGDFTRFERLPSV